MPTAINQVWRSSGTGNRWRILSIGQPPYVLVEALDGGRFPHSESCSTYAFDQSAFANGTMTLVEEEAGATAEDPKCSNDVIAEHRALADNSNIQLRPSQEENLE